VIAMRALSVVALIGSTLLRASPARATDADAARDELLAGYALKLAGDCHAALPHLLASYRLDPEPKAALNAADCEQRLGDLVSARAHAAQGLDLTRRAGDAELTPVAEGQLASIEKRVAQLTIVETRGVVSTISIDGLAWDFSSPTYLNPGSHTIVAHAPGHVDRSYPVTLGDGAHMRIEVTVGEKLDHVLVVAPPVRHDPDPTTASAERPGPADETPLGTRGIAALTIGGAGLVAVTVGSVFGVNAISLNNQSNQNSHCDSTGCDSTGKALRNQALSDASASSWLVGLGLVAAAGGVVLYLTAPTTSGPSTAHVEALPLVGPQLTGLGVRGAW
jgi:hypothetical protein